MDNQSVIANAVLQTKNINFDITYCPVRAQGTIDGVQYAAEVVTVAANTDVVLFAFDSSVYHPRLTGVLTWVSYDINFELKAGSATADLKWKLQARDKGGTWTDMCAEITETDINTTFVAKRIKGNLDIKTNITKVPFEMRLIFQSNEVSPGIGTGRVKNTTVIEFVGEVS